MALDLSHLELRTERLVMRPWQRGDLDVMARWPPFADPLEQTWNWAAQLGTMSLDFFFAAQQFDASNYIWTLLADASPIGLLTLHARDHARPTLGISLSGTAIGQGYGREALTAFFHAYFSQWPHNTIHLEVAVANRRAMRLYQGLHFQETGRFWRDAGPADNYGFIEHPRYRNIRSFFRCSAHGCYQLCAAMELEGRTWGRFVV